MHQEYSKTLHYAGEYQSSSSAKTLPNKRSVTIKTKKSALPSKITVLLHIKMFFETGQRRKRVPQSQKVVYQISAFASNQTSHYHDEHTTSEHYEFDSEDRMSLLLCAVYEAMQ